MVQTPIKPEEWGAAIGVWAVWGLWVNDVVAMTRRRGQNGTDAH